MQRKRYTLITEFSLITHYLLATHKASPETPMLTFL